MHRLLAVVVMTMTVGCAGNAPREPTLPSVNFTPKLVIEADDHGLRFLAGPRASPEVSLSPAAVGTGTVVEVRNTGTRAHRLRGGTAFDTGMLQAGEHTTVVLTNDTSDEAHVDITDVNDAAIRGSITVRPKS